MKIKRKFKVHNVAGENVVLVQGRNPGDLTSVIALNGVSLFLWNELWDKDFNRNQLIALLTDNYEVDETTAAADADKWIETLKGKGILEL